MPKKQGRTLETNGGAGGGTSTRLNCSWPLVPGGEGGFCDGLVVVHAVETVDGLLVEGKQRREAL